MTFNLLFGINYRSIFERIKQSIEAVCALMIPVFAMVTSALTIYYLVVKTTECPTWQPILSSGLLVVLAICVTGVLLHQVSVKTADLFQTDG